MRSKPTVAPLTNQTFGHARRDSISRPLPARPLLRCDGANDQLARPACLKGRFSLGDRGRGRFRYSFHQCVWADGIRIGSLAKAFRAAGAIESASPAGKALSSSQKLIAEFPAVVCLAWLGLDPPWRIEAILAGVIKADDVARGIEEPGLPPQPPLITWFLCKAEAPGLKRRYLIVERCALKVDNGVRRLRGDIDRVNRKTRLTNG